MVCSVADTAGIRKQASIIQQSVRSRGIKVDRLCCISNYKNKYHDIDARITYRKFCLRQTVDK
jgi:hypothetical protein